MELVNSYFRELVFTKVDEKQGFVIYGAGIFSGLGAGIARYVLLFVPSHLAFKTQGRIGEFAWQNLQTRQIPESYRLKKQPWTAPRDLDDPLLIIKQRTEKYSEFGNPELPFEVDLMHVPKKRTIYQYHDKIRLSAALETFQAIVNYTGQQHPFIYQQQTELSPPQSSSFSGWFQLPPNETIDDSFDLI